MKYYFLNNGEQNALLRWHTSLDKNRGNRARLRRAQSPEDVLLTDAFFYFLQQMPDTWQDDRRVFSSAAVAGLLSHIKQDQTSASFASLLARSTKGDRPPVSELRFQQLQKSRNTDDFYRRLLRTIRLLRGGVNVASLTNDIIHWHQEFNGAIDKKPSNRLAVRWATDYFTALAKKS